MSDELTRRSVVMILAQARAGAVTAVVMGAVIGLIYVPAAGWAGYLAWYLFFAAAMALRGPYFEWLVRRYGPTQRTLRRIALAGAFTGFLTPLSVALFSPWLSLAEIGLLSMIMVGWVSVAVSVLSALPRAYIAYLVASFSMIWLAWVRHVDGTELAVVAISLVLGGRMLIKLAQGVQGQLRDTVAASEQNASLVRQLRQALDRQEEAQRARTRFLGAASHDLRQPVQALVFLTGILRKTTEPARRDAMALEIGRTGESIDTMFRHLVDFAQIDAGTMRAVMRPVQLDRLVAAAVTGCAEKCAAKGLKFRLDMDAPPAVMADPVLLERLLRNFLDNAWKYSLQGTIVLRGAAEGGEVELSVTDEGVGMQADELEQACNAFYRGPSAGVAEAEGIGLGLAISRHISDLMDARLRIDSERGVGTRVCVRLGLAQQDAQDSADPSVERLRDAAPANS